MLSTLRGALVGLVAVLPVAFAAGAGQQWVTPSLAAWGSLPDASARSMLRACGIWARENGRRGVARTVPYMFLVPVVSGGLAALGLDEQFGPVKISGAALVLVGTAVVQMMSQRPPRHEQRITST